MTGYCISDQYCRYKSDTGYCGYSGGCVKENTATIEVPMDIGRTVQVVDISSDSINAIADAVIRKLKGEQP